MFCAPLSLLPSVRPRLYASTISPVSMDGFSPNFCHWCILGQRLGFGVKGQGHIIASAASTPALDAAVKFRFLVFAIIPATLIQLGRVTRVFPRALTHTHFTTVIVHHLSSVTPVLFHKSVHRELQVCYLLTVFNAVCICSHFARVQCCLRYVEWTTTTAA